MGLKGFRNSALPLHWPVTQYRHKFFISVMHNHGFGLIGPRQVHAVYTMHTSRTIYVSTTWRVTSGVPMLYRRYMYATCSCVARLVIVGLDSSLQSTILHPVPSVQRGLAGHRFASCRAICRSCRVGGLDFLGCWSSQWCLIAFLCFGVLGFHVVECNGVMRKAGSQ